MFSIHRHDDAADYYRMRIRIAVIVILVVTGVLLMRLWHLQQIRGQQYVTMARDNKVRLVRLPASRGRIMDSTGRMLADNNPGFAVSVVPGAVKDSAEVVRIGTDILGQPPEKLRTMIRRSRSIPQYLTYPLAKNLSLEQVSLLTSRMTGVKGMAIDVKPVRVYPHGETLCHGLGTLGEISGKELARASKMGYRSGDSIGKTGIEKEYESLLKGTEGWEQIEIDAKGRQLNKVTYAFPKPGADITLSVDLELQKFVHEVFVHRAGSVVVVDPDSGRILAMLSKPGFDLNLFSPSISRREWKDLNSDPLHPLENRSIRGLYSPASTFKIVLALAALQEKVVTPKDTFQCTGNFEVGKLNFRCWKRDGHGKVNLRRAIVESCDTYFYNLALKLGIENIARYASLFGLGKPTGLRLPQELPGLVPTPAWKQRTYREIWQDGETVTAGIGQGYMVCTPIQMAMMMVAVANGGKILRPSLVEQVRDRDGRVVLTHSPVVRSHMTVDPRTTDFLREALIGVVSDKQGTGRKCHVPGFTIAGKTGTSQVVRMRKGMKREENVPYHERAHAIFAAYVDGRPNRIALVVVVEHGGGGGETAAPLARKIICKYYGVPDPGDPEKRSEGQ